MGLGIGDVDNDGQLDLAFSNVGENKLLHNNGDGTFDDISASAGIERATLPSGETSITWATTFLDYNNDRLLDLFIAAGWISVAPFNHPNILFSNDDDGTFSDVSVSSGLAHEGRARAASVADIDEDGFVELFVGNYGEPAILYRNSGASGGNTHHWLTVDVVGTISNRDAIGALLQLNTPDGTAQLRQITSGPTHGGGDQRRAFFGLGSETEGELVVRWPSGIRKNFGTLAADQHLDVVEPAIELDLSIPSPGEAGQINAWTVTGGVEQGVPVELFASLTEGAPPIAGCQGVDGGLAVPVLLDTARLNAGGNAAFERFAPARFNGQTAYMQVVQRENCAVSNVVEYTFP